MEIKIYTDGAARNNPGPAGWGVVVLSDGVVVKELGGAAVSATNNQMELTATIEGLKYSLENYPTEEIHIFTDSAYTMNGITNWIHGWKKNGWRTAAKKAVLNKELWQELDEVHQKLNVKWHKVKGHSGDEFNDRADIIATMFADGESIQLA